MNLISFLKKLNITVNEEDFLSSNLIGNLKIDSRSIEPGDIYLSFPVAQKDLAQHYQNEAKQRGAALILTVPEPRRLWSAWAKYCFPHQPHTCVAVTGTNGKTSVVEFTRQLWQQAGLSAASLGTLGLTSDDISVKDAWPNVTLTTPDSWIIHQVLNQLANHHIQYAALEASSHGLDQHRLDQVKWTAAAFTNLSHEHLDYHKTMEAYFLSKSRLFQEGLPASGIAVLNRKDPHGQRLGRLCTERGIKILWFGGSDADLAMDHVERHAKGMLLTLSILGKKIEIDLPLIGLFQAENILAALGLVIASGLNVDQAIRGLANLKGVPGRMDYVGETAQGGAVYVDYAHKPMALENILKTAREHTAGKVSVVFGCGGNRDREKRPMMGKIAQTFADDVYVTDDNPRHESPDLIRAAILQKCPKALEIAARDQAIAKALSKCKRDDICIIAGKGHETGQIIKDKVFAFDDRIVVQQFLAQSF
ncbi:MAG: UDP-N-acetylmuramoyl-L-alanyl-D-glutamate--2,6-diaminopimelate ligase [Janthinobacterium lividum]